MKYTVTETIVQYIRFLTGMIILYDVNSFFFFFYLNLFISKTYVISEKKFELFS